MEGSLQTRVTTPPILGPQLTRPIKAQDHMTLRRAFCSAVQAWLVGGGVRWMKRMISHPSLPHLCFYKPVPLAGTHSSLVFTRRFSLALGPVWFYLSCAFIFGLHKKTRMATSNRGFMDSWPGARLS